MSIVNALNFYNMYKDVLNRKTLMYKAITNMSIKLFNGSYDKYHEYVIKQLSGQFNNLIDYYRQVEVIYDENDSKDIWMLWFQGKDEMIPVVKRCYKSACDNFKDYNIHLITYDNYMEFVNIPDFILNKVDEGKISKTHFSDILRFKLLRKYGGFWMDATLFATSNKPLSKDSFHTIKCLPYGGGSCVSNSRWCTFFLGGSKNNILFSFVDDCLTRYFKENNRVIDYYLIDYFIEIAYRNFNYVKCVIDNVDYNNLNLLELNRLSNSPFNSQLFNELKRSNQFFKLTYKKEFKETFNGKDTFYKKIILDGIQ